MHDIDEHIREFIESGLVPVTAQEVVAAHRVSSRRPSVSARNRHPSRMNTYALGAAAMATAICVLVVVLVAGVTSSKPTMVTPGRPAGVPASWQKVTFGGLTMYAPGNWPTVREQTWGNCATSGDVPFRPSFVVLNAGEPEVGINCPLIGTNLATPVYGVLVDPGPVGILNSVSAFAKCLHINGLSVCPTANSITKCLQNNGLSVCSTVPSYAGIVILAVHIPGVTRPVAVEIGLAGGGKVAHTILYSMRATGSPATSKPYTGPPIGSMLLTASDLPSGWAVDTSGNGSFLPASCGTDTPLETVHPEAYAAVTFSQTSNTAIELFEEVAFSDAAKSSLTSLEGILNACRTFSSHAATGTMTPLTFPRYTEQQAGFLISLPGVGGPAPWQLGFLIVRKGDYLVYLGYFPSTGPFNPRQLEAFVPAALARVPSS